jgi:hypothetical protein
MSGMSGKPDTSADRAPSVTDTQATTSGDPRPDVAMPVDANATDATATDPRSDSGSADLLQPVDLRAGDAAPVTDAREAGSSDTGATDGGPSFQPNPACNYFDAARNVLRCPEWTILTTMVSLNRTPMCPDYKVVELPSGVVRSFRTTQDAAAALGCDLTCVYQGPSTAGSLAYCGQSASFDAYSDGGPGQTQPKGACRGLTFYASAVGFGWYENFSAFQMAHPCPGSAGAR